MKGLLEALLGPPLEPGTVQRLWCVQCAKIVCRTSSVVGHRFPGCQGVTLDYPPGADLSEILNFTPEDVSDMNRWLEPLRPQISDEEWLQLHHKLSQQI
jgi:hypothetical protein